MEFIFWWGDTDNEQAIVLKSETFCGEMELSGEMELRRVDSVSRGPSRRQMK